MAGFGFGTVRAGSRARGTGAVASGTSASRYSFAATRFRWPTVSRGAGGTNRYFIQQFLFGSPAYPVTNPRFYAPSFHTKTDGTNPSEVAGSNGIEIEGLSISIDGGTTWIAGTGYPVTIDPATPGALLPAVAGVTIPADTVVTCRWAYNVPATTSLLPCTPRATSFGGSGLSESSEGGTSTRAAKLTTGALTNTGNHSDPYQPAFMVAQGGDGRAALIVVGDSIGYGQNEAAAPILWSNRGAFGYIQRGLDDATATKRIASASFCIPGARPNDWKTRANWSKKLDALRDVRTATGDWPFDEVISQHGNNSITTFATFLTLMQDYLSLLRTEWGKPITQVEMLARPTTSDGFATFASQTAPGSDGYPSGARWQMNAAIGSNGSADPATTLRAGGWIDGSFAAWPKTSYDTGSSRDRLQVLSFATTLAAAAAQGANIFSLTASPAIGAYLNFGANQADGQVIAVTGSGPYSVTCVMSTTPGTGGIAAGAAVNAKLHDNAGTHPGRAGHILAAEAVTDWKAARGWV